MSIPVVVVDDTEFDRRIARRRLKKCPEFDEPLEFSTGKEFLDGFLSQDTLSALGTRKAMILMDINMPGMSGFDVIGELEKRLSGSNRPSEIVMMLTSSDNPGDHKRAAELNMVKGYITKPLDDAGVKRMVATYQAN